MITIRFNDSGESMTVSADDLEMLFGEEVSAVMNGTHEDVTVIGV